MKNLYGDPTKPWTDWSEQIALKHSIESGHHMAEEAPNDVASQIDAFFAQLRWHHPQNLGLSPCKTRLRKSKFHA